MVINQKPPDISAKIKRPVLQYHGGKFRLAKWILEHMPPHRTYVEPFGGAASILLQKPRAPLEIYNDLDDELINLFQVYRDNGKVLADKLRLTPWARKEFLNSYEPSSDSLEQARRTVVRSFMGFGSNSHVNRTGFRSSPLNAKSSVRPWGGYPDAMPAIISRLQGVVIEHRNAVEVMRYYDNDQTLHYVDPPYVKSTRTDNADDYRHELTDEDHVSLYHALSALSGMIIISGYPGPLYDRLYSNWTCVTKKARADGKNGRTERTECLWLNPACMIGLEKSKEK